MEIPWIFGGFHHPDKSFPLCEESRSFLCAEESDSRIATKIEDTGKRPGKKCWRVIRWPSDLCMEITEGDMRTVEMAIDETSVSGIYEYIRVASALLC